MDPKRSSQGDVPVSRLMRTSDRLRRRPLETLPKVGELVRASQPSSTSSEGWESPFARFSKGQHPRPSPNTSE
ncbi:hypothetical protein NL676_012499 [Syzygium grande]|nr:hypothetical protein NL676_012499 [Syzygium grande]